MHAIEEGLGVEDGRAKWLSGELDKAFASGKKEEIEAVRNAIPRGNGEIEQLIVKVTHQLLPLERLAAQRRFFEALDAAKARDAQKERPPKAAIASRGETRQAAPRGHAGYGIVAAANAA